MHVKTFFNISLNKLGEEVEIFLKKEVESIIRINNYTQGNTHCVFLVYKKKKGF